MGVMRGECLALRFYKATNGDLQVTAERDIKDEILRLEERVDVAARSRVVRHRRAKCRDIEARDIGSREGRRD